MKNAISPGRLFLAILFAFSAYEPCSHAGGGYVSALAGAAVSTAPTSGTNVFIFSGRAGIDIVSDGSGILALGVFAAHDSTTTSSGSASVNGYSTPILGELIDRKAFGTGLYFGGRAGVGLENATITGGGESYTASATAFIIGPCIGYEISFSPYISFDIDTTWLSTSGATFTFPGLGSVATGSSAGLGFQGGFTFNIP